MRNAGALTPDATPEVPPAETTLVPLGSKPDSDIERALHAALGPTEGEKAWRVVQRLIPEILRREREAAPALAAARRDLEQARADLAEARRHVWLPREDVEAILADLHPGAHVDDVSAADLELRARVLRALEDHDTNQKEQ